MKNLLLFFWVVLVKVHSFNVPTLTFRHSSNSKISMSNDMNDSYEKKNAAIDVLSNFMQEKDESSPLDKIDFDSPKFAKVDLQTLAKVIDYELYNKEWFVTGNVNPIYFSDDFEFQDPDVKLKGIENYAKGVNKLFDQETARAEIISVVVDNVRENTLTVRWRLSGKVKIAGGLEIKPYICTTYLKVDPESGLIIFQEDEFDIPQWDILLSALFPFLIGKITKEPAPEVQREDVPTMPKLGGTTTSSILDDLFGFLF